MHVEFHILKDGKDQPAGVLRETGGKLVADPADNRRLQSILEEPLFDRESGDVVTADEPRRFLELLRFQYKSAYLRASAPLEDSKGDGEGV